MQYYCQLHSLLYTQVCLQHDCTRKGPLCDMCIDTHDQHLIKNLETYVNDQYKALQIDHQMNILQKLESMKTFFHSKISQLLIDVGLIDEKRKKVIVNQLKTEKMSIVQFQSKIVELVQRDQLKDREYLAQFYSQLTDIETQMKEAFSKLPTRQIQPQSHQQSQSQSTILNKPSLSTDKDILSEEQSNRSNKSKERIFQEKKLSVSPIRKQLMQRDLMPVGSFNNSKLKNYFTEQDSQQSVRSKQDTQNSFKITRPFEMDRSSERKFQFDGYQSKPQEKSQNASFEMFQPPHEHVQLENTHVSPMSIDTLYKSPVEAKSYILKSPSNQVPTSKSPQNQTMASKSPQNQPQSVFKFIQQEQQSQPDLNLFISPKNESFDHPQISNPTININSLQQSEKEEKQQFFDFQKEKSRNDQQKGFFGNTYSASEINRSPIQNPLATPSQSLSVIQNDRSFADPSTSMISSKSVALPQVKITPNLQNPFSIEQTQTLKAHDKSVKDLCFMDDDKLISCSRDCSIKIWDKKTYQMKMTLKDHTDQVLCVAFFKKRIIASGSADKTVRIWKPSPHWQMFRVCEGHTERIRCIGFVNQLIASGSDDTTLKLWDFEGELKHSHKTNGRVGALIPERHFVILTSGKNIQIFDTQIMAKKLEKPAHKNLVLCLALLSKSQNDGEGLLISGSKDNCIKLWQYPKLEELKCIEEDYPIQSVCFGPESFIILGLMGFEQEGKISIWKLDTNPKKVQEITVNPYGCNKVLYDSQSEMFYTAHENKRIEFINIKV